MIKLDDEELLHQWQDLADLIVNPIHFTFQVEEYGDDFNARIKVNEQQDRFIFWLKSTEFNQLAQFEENKTTIFKGQCKNNIGLSRNRDSM